MGCIMKLTELLEENSMTHSNRKRETLIINLGNAVEDKDNLLALFYRIKP